MSGLLFTLFTHAIVLLSSTTDQPQQQVSLCQRNSTSNRQSPYTVLVEGNVGSGKSTLVNILAGVEPRIDAIPEPVEAWQNVSGNLITAPLNKYLTINHATGRQPSFVKAVPDQYISVWNWKCPKKSHSTLQVYILSGKELPDKSLFIERKLVENAKIEKFKCDILSTI